jgi:uncharacterized LabA/DUF88 family protein
MRTIVYVDGFNLYYGALRKTPYRWLDLSRLCRMLLPHDDVRQLKYFTALVNPRPTDPDQRARQETYLRALGTIPNISITYGYFLTHEITMARADGKGFVKVIKTEEKGSDVNIATQMLVDGFRDAYDLAVVVSNDSDLLLPIRFVAEELGKDVGLLNPQKHPSMALKPHVRFIKQIRAGALSKCQFPPILNDAGGSFSKPSGW